MITLRVPGRLEVFGKHTDYGGGRSLVCAVPRGITMTADQTTDGRVVIVDLATNEQAVFSSAGDGPSDGWRRYPQTVVRRLAANFPAARLSARLELTSDLPQAAGMSSSSALIVAVAEALIACAGIEERDEWRAVVKGDRGSRGGCLERHLRADPAAAACDQHDPVGQRAR